LADTNTLILYRIIDANCNRLREALRVIEEYSRLVKENKPLSIKIKELRHMIRQIESEFDYATLLQSRNTLSDPLATQIRNEEMNRHSMEDVLRANLKRGQEAARVLEEYCKISQHPDTSGIAKKIRFDIYSLEQQLRE
jgi:hypothetical protein